MVPYRFRLFPTVAVILIVFFIATLTHLHVRLETFDLTEHSAHHHDFPVGTGEKTGQAPEAPDQPTEDPTLSAGQEDAQDSPTPTDVGQLIPGAGSKALLATETGVESPPPNQPHPVAPEQNRPIEDSESESEEVNTPLEESRAYIFYATTDKYACSVLINIRLLQQKFKTRYRIHVLVSRGVSRFYRSRMMEVGAEVTEHTPPDIHPDSIDYYEFCLLKLFAFKMHQIDPTLKRVLALDGDQMILQDLDHIFDLPSVDVAVPRIYWNKQPEDPSALRVTSAFMLIEPSDRLWDRVQAKIEKIDVRVYDMDIVNELFEASALVLPGSYTTLNSQWEELVLPSWYRGVPSPEPVRNFTRLSSDEAKIKSKQLKEEAWKNRDAADFLERIRLAQAVGSGIDKFPEGNAADEDLEKLWEQVQVLHFTAVEKPWALTTDTLKLVRPHAHEILYSSWQTWRTEAKELCDGLVDKI